MQLRIFFQTEVNKYGALLVEELVASVDLTWQRQSVDSVVEHIKKANTNGDGLYQSAEFSAFAADRREGRSQPEPVRIFTLVDADDIGLLRQKKSVLSKCWMKEHGGQLCNH